MFYEAILDKISAILDGESGRDEKLGRVAHLLHETIPYYDWVGFYLVDSQRPGQLVLGPFVGEPTEHVRIPFGRGVCGQVASTQEPMVVQDVGEMNNYLPCSAQVQSEIVVPIFRNGEFVGELDIDSHARGPFAEGDVVFLEKVARLVSTAL